MRTSWLINPLVATALFWVFYFFLGKLFSSAAEDLSGSISAWISAFSVGLLAAVLFVVMKAKNKKVYSIATTIAFIVITSFIVLRFDFLDFP